MLKQKLFIEQFIILIVIAILHHLALYFYFYWTFWWFDIIQHFLGGLWLGFIVLWFFFFSQFIYKDINLVKKAKIFSTVIVSVIAVGVLWEVWELSAGLVSMNEYGYFFDTSLDIIMDTLGGITAFLYAKKYLRGLSSRNRR